jgi:hypothetical protein
MSQSDRPVLLTEQPPHETTQREPGVAAEAPDARPSSDFRGWLFGLIQRVFLLVGIYVLSIGPMYWHWYGGRFGEGSQFIAAFYEPIFMLVSFVPWFGEWMDWYVGLWIA